MKNFSKTICVKWFRNISFGFQNDFGIVLYRLPFIMGDKVKNNLPLLSAFQICEELWYIYYFYWIF